MIWLSLNINLKVKKGGDDRDRSSSQGQDKRLVSWLWSSLMYNERREEHKSIPSSCSIPFTSSCVVKKNRKIIIMCSALHKVLINVQRAKGKTHLSECSSTFCLKLRRLLLLDPPFSISICLMTLSPPQHIFIIIIISLHSPLSTLLVIEKYRFCLLLF